MGRKRPDGATVGRALSNLRWNGMTLWADGFWSRLFGLAVEPPLDRHGVPSMLVLPRCRSVHTCGMRYPLDIAFVDKEGKVLASYEGVMPWRVLYEPKADFVVERASTCGDKATR